MMEDDIKGRLSRLEDIVMYLAMCGSIGPRNAQKEFPKLYKAMDELFWEWKAREKL